MPSPNTSGYRGVSFDRRSGYWVAYISVRKKRFSGGYHVSAEAAAAAYNRLARRLLGKRARFNRLPEDWSASDDPPRCTVYLHRGRLRRMFAPDEDTYIERERIAGVPARSIARELGRSRHSVYCRLVRLAAKAETEAEADDAAGWEDWEDNRPLMATGT